MQLRRTKNGLVNEDTKEFDAALMRAASIQEQLDDRSKLEELIRRVSILEERTRAQELDIKELKNAILSNT